MPMRTWQRSQKRFLRSDLSLAILSLGMLASLGLVGGSGLAWLTGRDHARPLAQISESLKDSSREAWASLAALSRAEFRLLAPAALETAQADADAAEPMPPRPLAKPRFLRRATAQPTRSVDALLARFEAINYDLDEIRDGISEVPRIFVSSLPDDLSAVQLTDKRKRAFLHAMLPLILKENEHILADRLHMLAIADRVEAGSAISGADRSFLDQLADQYSIDDSEDFDEFRRRVDMVPASLALAQSAEESGWGTSRYATAGNAVFGQMIWSADSSPTGAGLVPAERDAGARHEVQAFNVLQASVSAYMRNLNTHPAYVAFRQRRADQRESGRDLDGAALVSTLGRYSARGRDYLRTIRGIMHANGLESFDRAKLSDPVVQQLAGDITF